MIKGKKDKGFTLVELLIVIVILGILATVTVFAVRGITDKGQKNACSVEGRTLSTAVESYYAQEQKDPAAVGDLGPYVKTPADTAKWTFYAKGASVPAGNGPDGTSGTADDRAAVSSAPSAGYYGIGKCAGY